MDYHGLTMDYQMDYHWTTMDTVEQFTRTASPINGKAVFSPMID